MIFNLRPNQSPRHTVLIANRLILKIKKQNLLFTSIQTNPNTFGIFKFSQSASPYYWALSLYSQGPIKPMFITGKKSPGKERRTWEIQSLMANEDDEGEKSRSLHQQIPNKPKTQIIIGVPSYQEVLESSQTKSTPPSLFKPSQSFSQAFAFVKSSDVYSPPPPPPSSSAASSSQTPGASQVPTSRCYYMFV